SSQPKEVAEDVQRQAQLRRVDKDIEHLMRARYPLIYILSSEEKRVEKSIADVLQSREREKHYKTKIYTWSVTEGVRLGKEPQGDSRDPLKALRFVVEAKADERAVFILRDPHPYLKNPEVVRLLRDIGRKLKEELKTVFLISPLLAIPPELDKEVAVVEYPLPELLEIDAIFDRVSRNTGARIPSGQEREHVVEAALGLSAAKAVGAAWRLPLLRLDVGKIFAGIVGSSEENMRRAIQMAEAVAPSILWVDELEKGFSGTGSSNNSDAGTAARVFGSFITWLQE